MPTKASLWQTSRAREVSCGFGELDELILAYTTTIRKSQGPEYPAVVIPLTTQHYTMLARNLLYTQSLRFPCLKYPGGSGAEPPR